MATLRAGAELADLPVKNCVLISGSQTGVLAAERVAMPCVVIRNRYIFCWNPVSYLYCLGVFLFRTDKVVLFEYFIHVLVNLFLNFWFRCVRACFSVCAWGWGWGWGCGGVGGGGVIGGWMGKLNKCIHC